ncbi:MAG: nitrous oxide reductase accessory protein NosL [Desulfobacteraceae bacterium]|nr:MAG: nitrous oxide reductase accessory protein NosL [Desulfobacteraceae bacterium]
MVCWTVVFLLLLLVGLSRGADVAPREPSKQDKCPVCGMFVYKFPEWTAQITFKDGTVVFFDGAKDLFKYYFDLKKYSPRKTKADIRVVYVTEYYAIKPVVAQDASFVIGSDVYGPMGRELIPIGTAEGAREFLKDHKGKRILRFDEITPAVIDKLE